MRELWQEICFILNDIPQTGNEELYEQKIIQSLEKLGWSRFRKEIILKESYQLGSAGTIIPDIIVKSLEKTESFVIEAKRPSVDIEKTSHKKQLFSYMRQLKLQHGLLIGNKIQIYYDGNLNKTDDPILLNSIDILESNKDGLLFVELFHKDNFAYSLLENFAKKTIEKLTSEKHKNKLRNILLSTDYKQQIQQFIADDLSKNWDEESIKTVMDELSISIYPKDTPQPSPQPIPPQPRTTQGLKIGQLVKTNMNKIIVYCKKSEEELINLKSREYSKKTFNINYPFLKEVPSASPKQERYWKDKYLINNKYYVVTSEWYKGSVPLLNAYLARISQR